VLFGVERACFTFSMLFLKACIRIAPSQRLCRANNRYKVALARSSLWDVSDSSIRQTTTIARVHRRVVQPIDEYSLVSSLDQGHLR